MTKLNKYIMCMFVITMISVFLFSGCNKGVNSAEEALAAMQEKASETTSFSADVELKLDMDYSVEGVDGNMVLVFDEYFDAILETKEIYTQGSMNVTDVYDEAWESFVIKSDDAYESYSCIDGEWYYNDVTEESLDKGPAYLIDAVSEIEGYSFKKNIDYIIEAKADSEDIVNILNCLYANVIDSAFSEGVDTSNMTGTITIRLDIVTCLPVSLEIVFDDCSDMFVGDDMFESASINEFVLTVEFSKYNETDNIAVPASVTDLFELPEGDDLYDDSDNSEDSEDNYKDIYFEDENGDVIVDSEGYYELKDYQGIASIKIKSPEGYIFSPESDPTMVSFDKENVSGDNYCTLIYEMAAVSDSNTKEDVAGNMEIYYNFYSTDETYKQMEYIDNQSIAIDDITVNYSGMKYYYEGDDFTQKGYYTWYYYWAFIDEYAVMCNVTDYASDGFADFDATAMAELLFKDIRYSFD